MGLRDLYSNLTDAQALEPGVYTATVNGPGVDLREVRGCLFNVGTGVNTGAAVFGVKVQESDDNVTFADVASKWFKSDAPSILAASSRYRIGYTGKKRYVRLVFTYTSGTSLAMSAGAILDPLTKPVP